MPDRAFLLLALLVPWLLLPLHLGRGHAGDLDNHWRWAEQAAGSLRHAYVRAPDLNYPPLGAAALLAPAAFAMTKEGYRRALKVELALAESALALGAFSLARRRRLPRPGALSLAITASPATWAVGSYFGQLDLLGAALLVGAAALAARALLGATDERPGARFPLGVLAGALALGAAALLEKQLCWFAWPGVTAISLASAFVLARRKRMRESACVLAATVGSLGLLLLPDLLLSHPPGTHTLIALVWSRGPHHADMLGNGPNLWGLLHRGATDSSHTPLVAGGWLSPYAAGLIAFFTVQLLLGALGLRHLLARGLDHFASEEGAAALLRACVLWAGLSSLAMGTLLAGSHERYLAHAFPLLALAVEGPRVRAFVLAASAYYGLYVLSTVEWDVMRHWPLVPYRTPALALMLAVGGVVLAREVRRLP